MASDRLRQAHDELTTAVETTDDDTVREDIAETAAAFDDFASGERTADHAVMDSHLNALRQAQRRATADTVDYLDQALEHAEEYRKTLDQA